MQLHYTNSFTSTGRPFYSLNNYLIYTQRYNGYTTQITLQSLIHPLESFTTLFNANIHSIKIHPTEHTFNINFIIASTIGIHYATITDLATFNFKSLYNYLGKVTHIAFNLNTNYISLSIENHLQVIHSSSLKRMQLLKHSLPILQSNFHIYTNGLINLQSLLISLSEDNTFKSKYFYREEFLIFKFGTLNKNHVFINLNY